MNDAADRLNALHAELSEVQKLARPASRRDPLSGEPGFIWRDEERAALVTVMDAVKDTAAFFVGKEWPKP